MPQAFAKTLVLTFLGWCFSGIFQILDDSLWPVLSSMFQWRWPILDLIINEVHCPLWDDSSIIELNWIVGILGPSCHHFKVRGVFESVNYQFCSSNIFHSFILNVSDVGAFSFSLLQLSWRTYSLYLQNIPFICAEYAVYICRTYCLYLQNTLFIFASQRYIFPYLLVKGYIFSIFASQRYIFPYLLVRGTFFHIC